MGEDITIRIDSKRRLQFKKNIQHLKISTLHKRRIQINKKCIKINDKKEQGNQQQQGQQGTQGYQGQQGQQGQEG